MFLATTLKRPVWIASGAVTGGVLQFAAPVEYQWNWRTLSSDAEIMAFGPSYMDYRIAVTTDDQVENLRRLDKVWMDTTPSDPTDVMASDADFYVVGISRGAGMIAEVMLKRLSPDA